MEGAPREGVNARLLLASESKKICDKPRRIVESVTVNSRCTCFAQLVEKYRLALKSRLCKQLPVTAEDKKKFNPEDLDF